MVPGVLELVADVQPCLFDVLDVVWGPVVDQSVESSDVVDDDLIPWVSELFVVLVVDDVCQPTLMSPRCVASPCRSAILYRGASPWPSKPQKATGWTPPRWSRSLVRMLGSLRLRSLIRLCLFFLNLCWRVAMRLLLPAE